MYLIYLEIDPTQIDINIHPTKTEIKFQDERAIYAIIHAAVRRALGKFSISPSIDFEQETSISLSPPRASASILPPKIDINPAFNPFESKATNNNRSMNLRGWFDSKERDTSGWRDLMEVATRIEDEKNEGSNLQLEISDEVFFQQHNRRYILCSSGERMMIIDQQRAHQRIRFERCMQQLESGKGSVQQIMFPETIELTPIQESLLVSFSHELESLGFRYAQAEGRAIELTGAPAEINLQASSASFLEALTALQEEVPTHAQAQENMCWQLAASGSIRYGQMLTFPEMESLFQQLMQCTQPYYWRNRKPIIIEFNAHQLSEYFK
jgi:DNA mismatch repair protein MutL